MNSLSRNCVPRFHGLSAAVPRRLFPRPAASALADLERGVPATHVVAGCQDYGRIGVRLRDGIFYVLDINPETSLSNAKGERACS